MIDDLVSIITPTYCSESTIKKTILSVQNQSYQNWELLITDDCSNDNTKSIVESFAKNDKRIKYFSSKKNLGPSAARNKSIEKSRGRWLAFLDSDDLWLPSKIEESINFLIINNYSFMYTGYKKIDLSDKLISSYISVPKSLNYEKLLGNTAIATSTVMLDKLYINNFKMPSVYHDDFVAWLSILKNGFMAYGLNKDLMRYRTGKSSYSSNKFKNVYMVWVTYRNIENISFFLSFFYLIKYITNALIKHSK